MSSGNHDENVSLGTADRVSEGHNAQRIIVCTVGTRPEVIKMAPIIQALGRETWADVRVLATGQHRELLHDALKVFNLSADIDLDLMRPKQSLARLTTRMLRAINEILERGKPDAVLVQGDTTTVLCAALASFYNQVPIGHVEAGLRTGDVFSPFPEEANRALVSRLAKWHFCATSEGRDNLIKEGIVEQDIYVTGNTVIDALLAVAKEKNKLPVKLGQNERLILVTCHRRENFGDPLGEIFRALRTIACQNDNVKILFPVHPNPNVRERAYEILSGIQNVTLTHPLDYRSFVAAMKASYFIISDSGGVQEEAPALNKPVLVVRNSTERPEAVAEGVVRVVGTNCDEIITQANSLLSDATVYKSMARGVSPYGDGRAAERIVAELRAHFRREDAGSLAHAEVGNRTKL